MQLIDSICQYRQKAIEECSYRLKKEFEKNIKLLQEQGLKERQQEENQHSQKQLQTDNKPTIPTPRVKSNPKLGGIELTNEQVEKLKSGNYIYLKNMINRKTKKPISAYVITDDLLTKAFFFNQPPDNFVKYGKYEMRLMDKTLIEQALSLVLKWNGMVEGIMSILICGRINNQI